MSFFNRKKPDEFISEMPTGNEYDDEEYYGEEDGEYAEDGEEEDYDEDEDAAPAPKKNFVKTALMGVAAVAVVLVGGFYAANFFAPEMTQEMVNNLPFVNKGEPAGGDQFTDVPGTSPAPDGEVAPPPGTPIDPTASTDVAAVPPVPKKPQPVKPTPRKVAPKPTAKPKPVQQAAAPVTKWTPAPKPWKPAAKRWTPAAKRWTPPAKRWTAPRQAAAPRYSRYYAAKPRYAAPRYSRYNRSAYSRARYAAYSRARYAAYNRTRVNTRYTRAYASPRAAASRYAVQVGSFSEAGNAVALVGQLRAQGINAYTSGNAGTGHQVRSVAVRNRANARRLLTQYRAAGYPARIVPMGKGLVAVSAGVFTSPERAQSEVAKLNQRGLYATSGYTQGAPTNGLARVYIGSYGTRAQAAARMRQLQNQGIPAAVTTR